MLPRRETTIPVTELHRRELAARGVSDRRAPRATSRRSSWLRTTGRRGLLGAGLAATLLLGHILAPVSPTAGEAPADLVLAAEDAPNREAAHRFFDELLDQVDLTVTEEIIAPDAVLHSPGGDLRGLEEIGSMVALFRTAFPDATFLMEDIVVEGDTVAVRWMMQGTLESEFQGVVPTGAPVEMPGAAFLRIEDGRIVEAWVTYDTLDLVQQLQAPSAQRDPAPGVSAPIP